ncbi:hypothetical protein BGZ60DRAFT_409572 [Tricladium varicosporioides]|nr:hypothetical protein BGZ60DRAFT_409572 [Hymenoscyphus varicosporioides]
MDYYKPIHTLAVREFEVVESNMDVVEQIFEERDASAEAEWEDIIEGSEIETRDLEEADEMLETRDFEEVTGDVVIAEDVVDQLMARDFAAEIVENAEEALETRDNEEAEMVGEEIVEARDVEDSEMVVDESIEARDVEAETVESVEAVAEEVEA